MIFSLSVLFFLPSVSLLAQQVIFKEVKEDGKLNLILSNPKISYTLIFDDKKLLSDKILSQKDWTEEFDESSSEFESDGNFSFDVMFSCWRPPGKQNNADNSTILNKENYFYKTYQIKNKDDGGKELRVSFTGKDISLQFELTVRLSPNDFYPELAWGV
jgi:hypothetical protein